MFFPLARLKFPSPQFSIFLGSECSLTVSIWSKIQWSVSVTIHCIFVLRFDVNSPFPIVHWEWTPFWFLFDLVILKTSPDTKKIEINYCIVLSFSADVCVMYSVNALTFDNMFAMFFFIYVFCRQCLRQIPFDLFFAGALIKKLWLDGISTKRCEAGRITFFIDRVEQNNPSFFSSGAIKKVGGAQCLRKQVSWLCFMTINSCFAYLV